MVVVAGATVVEGTVVGGNVVGTVVVVGVVVLRVVGGGGGGAVVGAALEVGAVEGGAVEGGAVAELVVTGGRPGRWATALPGCPRYSQATVITGTWQRSGQLMATGNWAVLEVGEEAVQPSALTALTRQFVPAGWSPGPV